MSYPLLYGLLFSLGIFSTFSSYYDFDSSRPLAFIILILSAFLYFYYLIALKINGIAARTKFQFLRGGYYLVYCCIRDGFMRDRCDVRSPEPLDKKLCVILEVFFSVYRQICELLWCLFMCAHVYMYLIPNQMIWSLYCLRILQLSQNVGCQITTSVLLCPSLRTAAFRIGRVKILQECQRKFKI